MHINAHSPEADGIGFEDTRGMSPELINLLAARGLLYLTEFRANGRRYTGDVIAANEAHAELIVFGRGLGEVVLGPVDRAGRIG